MFYIREFPILLGGACYFNRRISEFFWAEINFSFVNNGKSIQVLWSYCFIPF